MTNRFFKLTALLLAFALMLTGCSLVTVDEAMEMAEAAAVVGGEKITKADVMPEYEYRYAYYQYLYSLYGMNFTDADSVKDEVLEAFISAKILAKKAEELGLNTLDDETQAELRLSAEEQFETAIADYADQATGGEEMDEETARTTTIAYLEENGVTVDALYEELSVKRIEQQVRDYVVKDADVTDEEIQIAYDDKVAADETSYASSTYSFESAMQNGTTVAWMPEGYRKVKHILLNMTDEQSGELTALNTELENVESQIADLEAAADEPEAEATEAPEADEPEETAAPAPTMEELTAQKAEIEGKIAAKKAEILASFDEKIAEIQAKIEAGEDFDTLVAEYGEDPGMKEGAVTAGGYYISAASTSYDADFAAAAVALGAVGDISDPVLSQFGVHIIRYDSDVVPGAVGIEVVRESLSESLLTAKQNELYDATYDEWYKAANVKKYPGVMK